MAQDIPWPVLASPGPILGSSWSLLVPILVRKSPKHPPKLLGCVSSGIKSKDFTWNTRIPNHTKRVQRRMGAYLDGETRNSLKNTPLKTKKHSQRVLSKDLPPQITVVSLPDDYIHYNRKMPRTLSVRECARLQTFPDDFKFYGKRTTGGLRRRIEVPQYTQVGNAIPPRFAKAIANHIKQFIN